MGTDPAPEAMAVTPPVFDSASKIADGDGAGLNGGTKVGEAALDEAGEEDHHDDIAPVDSPVETGSEAADAIADPTS